MFNAFSFVLGWGGEMPYMHLKRPLPERLFSDATQKRVKICDL